MNSWFTDILEQLLADPRFISWAKGERPQDHLHWENWAGEDPERKEVLEKAREMVIALETPGRAISDQHIETRIRQALATAKKLERTNRHKETNSWFSFSSSAWTMAASLFIVMGLGFALFRIYKNNRQETNQQYGAVGNQEEDMFRRVSNQDNTLKYVSLPDGSAVVLHKNSSVRFPKQFDNSKREVYLVGEAFFEVIKNPDQPFFVYANELVAKVHGTSFSIKAVEKEEQVIVAVKTGKVSVFAQADAKAKEYETDKALTALVLTCNQQATFERSHARLVRSATKSPVLLNIPIENQVFTYAETPVAEVFASLGKAYGIEIAFNRETMAHCSITATLGDEPLENKLKWICAILEAEFEVNQDKITIRGNPCK